MSGKPCFVPAHLTPTTQASSTHMKATLYTSATGLGIAAAPTLTLTNAGAILMV